MFKYFKDSEISNLNLKLVQKLELAREDAQIPFIITSGYRTDAESVAAGGYAGDPHTKGLAVDLHCVTGQARFKIINSLLRAGFIRIGDEVDHIHADIDTNQPQNVIWRK